MVEVSNPEPANQQPDQLSIIVSKILSILWDIFKTVIIVGLIAILIRLFLIEPFIVQGSSMEKSLFNLDYLLIEKVSDNLNETYSRGSIVVFHPPDQPNQNYIKRVIGLPNEIIFIRNNQVVIQNNQNPQGFVLNEPYLGQETITEGTIKTELKDNQYFLMGDNRDNSKDSRSFGVVNKDKIIGKTWAVLYSPLGPHIVGQPSY